MKVVLDLSNYATKAFKDATWTCCDISKFAKTIDLTSWKPNVHKLGIDKINNVRSDWNNLKSKIDELDVVKLIPVSVDLSKLSDAVKNNVVRKDVYNAKIKNIEYKILDINNLATNTTLNAKIT